MLEAHNDPILRVIRMVIVVLPDGFSCLVGKGPRSFLVLTGGGLRVSLYLLNGVEA